MKNIVIALAALALGALAFAGPQDKPAEERPAEELAVIAAQAPSYPLTTCPISGEAFTAEKPAVDVVVDGRLIRTCCNRCAGKVKQDPAAAIKMIDDAVIAEQKPLWPLKSCPVSGEAYGGDMGEPLDFVVGTRYVKLCCKGCVRAVKKDPAAFLTELDAKLMPELAKSYPLKTCIVSGEPLDAKGAPVDFMYGHRLVRLCCNGCKRAFKKDPAGTMAKIYGGAAPAADAKKVTPKEKQKL